MCLGGDRDRKQIRQCVCVWGVEVGFCAVWGCEIAGSTYWKPTTTHAKINIKAAPGSKILIGGCGGNDCGTCNTGNKGRCNLLVLSFTTQGKQADWTHSTTWGIFLYRLGKDPFALFLLSRTLTTPDTKSIGPNPVLPDQRPLSRPGPPPQSLSDPPNNTTMY